ncbi:MAG: hypothetical protein WB424_07510 [Terracidiphilus sp.]
MNPLMLRGITPFYTPALDDDSSFDLGSMLTGPSGVGGGDPLGKTMSTLGIVTAVAGAVGSAFGNYYAAKNAQYQEKSQASSLAFQSDMASINASRAEMTAESVLEAGKNQIANYTMAEGEQKAESTTSMAARGISLGVGSAVAVSASQDVQKDLNVMAINSNATRQAWAAREQGTNYSNEALLDRTGSVNALRSAGSISPVGSAVNSLLGSATQIAGQWDYSQWLKRRLAQAGQVAPVGIGSGSW